MTRSELYELVWKEPMTHVAKRFGISDVALRKTCVKHNIPTPPLGYWAKLAHGKNVVQPPLPPSKGDVRKQIRITLRVKQELPPAVSAALIAAREREAAPEHRITVPRQRPAKLHPIVAATEKALRKAKTDDEGFLHCGGPDCFNLAIGPSSIERAVLILETLAMSLPTRGYAVSADKECVHILADSEPFRIRIYETKSKSTYQPTPADLKRQAEYDERSRRHPTLYPAGNKVWRTWTYYPSGRLCIELSDPTRYSWNNEHLVGRWYDRKNKSADEYLREAIVALAPAAALIKHRRAEAEEKARIQSEETERRRQQQARRERAAKRRDYLFKKADAYAQHRKLVMLAELLTPKANPDGATSFDHIARTLTALIEVESRQFEVEEMNAEIARLGLITDDDCND